MGQNLLSDRGWSGLLARLPAGLDLEGGARATGAFARARGVRTPQALLRLALVYANTPLSLRATAAWAAAAGVAVLSDVALLYRLQQLEGWLGDILAALLGEVVRAPGTLARPVQVVDATSLGWPGPRKGVAWRIHARRELVPTRFSGFVLTDGGRAGRLDRFAPTPGAIRARRPLPCPPWRHGRGLGGRCRPGRALRAEQQRRAADWLALLTTLDAATWPSERVAALYRLRWQIELAFKRLKSQLRLADLQAKDPRLARACMLARLILALLADRLVAGDRHPFRHGPPRPRRPPCGA